MRLAASYNFFNGEEHFLDSIRSIRPYVEVISVVWQKISNAGEPISDEAREVLNEAARRGWVDTIHLYTPNLSFERADNERVKRRIGLDLARTAGASHFLNLDTDEIYRGDEFSEARRQIEAYGWQSTSVSSFLHVKRPIYRARDRTNCCFITQIGSETEIGVPDFPCDTVDDTRKMTADPDTHHHFPADVVAMYHMNLIRRDLSSKLRNSSSRNTAFLGEVERVVRDWMPGDPLYFPKKGLLDIKQVPNEFGTYDPGAPC